MKLAPVLTLCCGVFSLLSGARAAYFETSAPPRPADHYLSAKYRLWIPDNVPTLRGIIIRQHGCGEGATRFGLTHANDLQWQELARKHKMALLGPELRSAEMCAQWNNIAGGSGDALLRALEQLARESGHPELLQVPWALFGHSGGAYWSTGMLFRYPERILAVIARSGGYPFMEWSQAVKHVPVLMAAGIDDRVDNMEYSTVLTIKSFLAYRRFGSPWVVAIDPKADHGNANGRRFYIPYMDAMLSLRLPDEGYRPKPIDATRGWQGDPKTADILPVAGTPKRGWAWFPDESLARQWQEFVRTGTVSDSTPPPAPTSAQIKPDAAGKMILTWDARIDLESGIKLFRIYRDDSPIGSVEGQHSNHGDAPEPAECPFRYEIKGFSPASRYTLSAINHQNLESARSVVARLMD